MVNNDGAATRGTHSLFTPLASTPDELLAVILSGSSVPALMDYVQINGRPTDSERNGEDFGEEVGVRILV